MTERKIETHCIMDYWKVVHYMEEVTKDFVTLDVVKISIIFISQQGRKLRLRRLS